MKDFAPTPRNAVALGTLKVTRILSTTEFVPLFLARRPWVLWLGSAVSVRRPSAVPTARSIRAALLDELASGGDRAAAHLLVHAHDTCERVQAAAEAGEREGVDESRSMPFEVLLEEVGLHTGQFVPRLLHTLVPDSSGVRFNRDHAAAASLLRSGALAGIVTTNWDEFLEGALSGAVDVVTPLTESFELGAGTVLKLHGTISKPNTLAASVRGVELRAQSDDWRASLVRVLSGRHVLFVGYSFSDRFDITPLLAQAVAQGARLYWADLPLANRPHVPIEAKVVHDLSDARTDLLFILADAASDEARLHASAEDDDWLSSDVQHDIAHGAVRTAADATALSIASRLAAYAALLYWIEQGEDASDLFAAARDRGGAVDGHIMARAYARARRYRAAVREFDALLARQLPNDPVLRALKTVDWCIGAGWCARAGGRPGRAERYHERATEALRTAELAPEDLEPYLADQYLRGTAGQHIRLAEMSVTTKSRARHLEEAENLIARLQGVPGLSAKTRSLQRLALAQIALLRRQKDVAASLLEGAKAVIERYGDPHDLAVCHRLLALTAPHRYGSLRVRESALAWRGGRRLEWMKIQLERLGFGGPGRLDPVRWRLRNALIALWDYVKEVA